MIRFRRVDELVRPDHSYLAPDDLCIYLREYTPGVGYQGGETNSLILNFKKAPDRRGLPEWVHKERAVAQLTQEFVGAFELENLAPYTLVPMPPSKAKADPLYDDRMVQVLQGTKAAAPNLDVRELLLQTRSADAGHKAVARPRPEDIRALLAVDEALASPAPRRVILFDDVLTTGAHFVAAKGRLQERFPGVEVIGCFVARRVPRDED